MDKFSFEYFEKKVKAERKAIIKLEDELAERKEAYRRLIHQKAAWEYEMNKKIFQSQNIPVEL